MDVCDYTHPDRATRTAILEGMMHGVRKWSKRLSRRVDMIDMFVTHVVSGGAICWCCYCSCVCFILHLTGILCSVTLCSFLLRPPPPPPQLFLQMPLTHILYVVICSQWIDNYVHPESKGVRSARTVVVRTRSDASARTALARWTSKVVFLSVLVSTFTTLACMYSEDWVKQSWHLTHILVTDAHAFVQAECAVVDDLGLGADSH